MTAGDLVRVGLIGCGFISDIYLKNAPRFGAFEIVACADAVPARAAAQAAKYDTLAMTVEEMLADPEIEIVLNLTTPNAHAAIGQAALESGKGAYNEKPLAIALADGARLVKTAHDNRLRLGAAPDTFLGAGLQTCRRLIDDGAIGQPVAGDGLHAQPRARALAPPPRLLLPSRRRASVRHGAVLPDGAGLAAGTGAAGDRLGTRQLSRAARSPASRAPASGSRSRRPPTWQPCSISPAAPSSPSSPASTSGCEPEPRLEIYGSDGSLSLPDPNRFGGPVRILPAGEKAWHDVPITLPWADNSRGLGLADMASGLRSGSPHRASGELAYHVLEVMHAVEASSRSGRHIEIASTVERSEPLGESEVRSQGSGVRDG